MPQIFPAGAINTTALIVPDLYVQIVPPAVSQLNGVPSNVLGVVGTATWGPVNAPTVVGNMAQYAALFGAIQPRKYDMGTAIAAAVLQGAQNFRCVRATDGTDTAATIVAQSTCITFTSIYTGTLGNSQTVQVAAGSAAGTSKVIVGMPGQASEVFDNIPGVGNALWVNMAAAINNGNTALRGPSKLIVATAGAGVTAPALATYTLAGGADGATTITGSVLVGVDTGTRKGMYSLRGTGAAVAMLADCDDSTTWATQVSYGLSEGTYMIATGPAGDNIANAATTKSTAGIDTYAMKLLFGDWVYFLDTVNGLTRLISPQGFIAGLLSNLAPQNSTLNKPLYGVVGTQRSYQNLPYSSAELQLLGAAGIDVIANPSPGGSYFGARFGHNSSSSSVANGDNYTRMTNYLAATFGAGMGKFVGKLQGSSPTDPTRRQVAGTVGSFLQGMVDQAQIDSFTVQCDLNNNSLARIATGYLQADVSVKYLAVVEKFLLNLQGGQSVTVNKVSSTGVA
ncbi:phage tail protein [Dyella halodurans]|uniref:Phage tail protein n=1 Tax=Dyella halodurans TaxID=1920171 RepID=A0ABV9C085_9GAMM|nr:hypothetical protein [Dyella halodurans]